MGLGEGIKFQLSQALIRGARLDSNSRLAVQISNPLPLRYAKISILSHQKSLFPSFRHG